MRAALLLLLSLSLIACGSDRPRFVPPGFDVLFYASPTSNSPHKIGPPIQVTATLEREVLEALRLRHAAARSAGLDPARRLFVKVFVRPRRVGVPCGLANGGGCYTGGDTLWLNRGPKNILPHAIHEMHHAFLHSSGFALGADPTHAHPLWGMVDALDRSLDASIAAGR